MSEGRQRLELYLLRHADAGQPGRPQDDAERPLSDKGIRQSERLAVHLALVGFKPDVIVSSPKLRALQTAEIVAAALRMDVRVEDALGEALGLADVERVLADAGNPARPLLVGHDPDFSALLSTLVGAGEVPMRKGALARVDIEPPIAAGRGTLRWLLPPELLPPEP